MTQEVVIFVSSHSSLLMTRQRDFPPLKENSAANDSLCFNYLQKATHRLGWSCTGKGSVNHPVLLNLACGWLPAHIQGVGGGVVHLDIPGWHAWNCKGERGEEKVKLGTRERC